LIVSTSFGIFEDMALSKKKKRWLSALSVLCAAILISYPFRYDIVDWVREKTGWELPVNPRPDGVNDLQWCETNYHDEIYDLSLEHDVPYAYLMSLIVLECGGNKPAGHRYEKHIFNKLKKVKEGKIRKFENIKQEDLTDADEEALKNLATSWGPFQLMGYKAIALGVNVGDLRNEETAAEVGVKWIKKEYGHFLAKKKWKDAFHYHNTGDRFPLSGHSHTHDPYYVSDGVKNLKYFEKQIAKKTPSES
jgi:hypothetical protein